MVIRKATAADVVGVVALERSAAAAPHWAAGEYAGMVGAEGESLVRCLLVAEKGRGLVGFAVGKVAAGVGEIESVAVAAEARRLGVGRELCGAVVAWCRREGAAEVELEVRVGSEGAIALYRGLGFCEVGRRRGYYREPEEDALLMHLELGQG